MTPKERKLLYEGVDVRTICKDLDLIPRKTLKEQAKEIKNIKQNQEIMRHRKDKQIAYLKKELQKHTREK